MNLLCDLQVNAFLFWISILMKTELNHGFANCSVESWGSHGFSLQTICSGDHNVQASLWILKVSIISLVHLSSSCSLVAVIWPSLGAIILLKPQGRHCLAVLNIKSRPSRMLGKFSTTFSVPRRYTLNHIQLRDPGEQ